MNVENNTQDRELLIERTINAPLALVWEAWTNAGQIANWWGPHGFTCTISKMEVRPGGEWNLLLHGPDGTDYKNRSIFKEIIPLEKIVFDHVSAPKFVTTVTFEAQGEQTLLNWHMLFETTTLFTQVVKTFKADEGLIQNTERLNTYLGGFK